MAGAKYDMERLVSQAAARAWCVWYATSLLQLEGYVLAYRNNWRDKMQQMF